jgi:hypothetical protein
MKLIGGFFLFFPFLLQSLSWSVEGANGFSAEAFLSEGKVEIPHSIHLELELTFPQGFQVDLPSLREHLLRNSRFQDQPFHLVSEHKKMEARSKEQTNFKQKISYELEPLIPGRQSLTFLAITFMPENTTTLQPVKLISGIFFVDVLLPILKEKPMEFAASLLPIDTPFPIEMDPGLRRKLIDNPDRWAQEALKNEEIERERAFPWLAILGIALAFLFYLSLKLIPKRELPKLKRMPKSSEAYKQAFQILRQLKQVAHPSFELYDCFFVQAADAVRYAIEEQYHIPAVNQTSQEFLQEISKKDILSLDMRQQLARFLEGCDRVKFALHHPSLEECENIYAAASKFI